MKKENFYRRDPSKALSGMIGLSLEERGVYNTVLDLLYSTWRPLEDDRAFIANWCGCAVQKLNPIIRRLVERGRLITFTEGGRTYLSDEAFEEERKAVKGAGKSRSGRAEVGEKSGEVGQKSAGAEENPPSCDDESKQNQSVAALEKTREDKRREETPKPPEGAQQLDLIGEPDEPPPDPVRAAFEQWNTLAEASGLPLAKDLTEARRRSIGKRLEGAGLAGWAEALAAVKASAFCLGQTKPKPDQKPFKADIDFVCQAKSFQRLREGYYGADAKPPKPPPPPPNTDGPWPGRIREWTQNRYWNVLDWGPRPGHDGCLVPDHLQPERSLA